MLQVYMHQWANFQTIFSLLILAWDVLARLKKNKKTINIMLGDLGNTWRYNFYMGTQISMNLERFFFIHTFKSKIHLLPIIMFVQGRHAFAMFYTLSLREKWGIPVMHTHIMLTTFTRFAQNSIVVCMLIFPPTGYMSGCGRTHKCT